ncbi:MAG: PAS domain S-box protein [Gemmatimonadetes bacterium]|nr:MAG: PAS domain S-box protein [Gemmatimonadota bacterium]
MNVLVIDDDIKIRGLLEKFLVAKGYTVTLKKNGTEGLEAFSQGNYEIVILDIMMPHMDGYELARRLRGIPGTEDTFLLAMTAYDSPDVLQNILDAGVDDYVAKPFKLRLLDVRLKIAEERIEGRIRRRAAEQKLAQQNRLLQKEIAIRRRIEQQLRKLEKAIETVEVGVTITDPTGKIIYINPADAHMHGYSVSELIGKNASIFGKAESRREMKVSEFARAENWKRESVNVRKDGSEFPVQLVSSHVKDENGNLIGMVTVSEDITERKEAERKLLEALRHLEELNQEKTEILGIVSHDLKNPLTTIIGNAQMVTQLGLEPFTAEDLLSMFRDIEITGKRMFNLIENLLDLNRLESGNLKLELETTDLRELVQYVVSNHQVAAQQKSIELHLELPSQPLEIYTDPDAVVQILDNLISNAIKYSPPGKNVFIRSLYHSERIRCEIQDEGQGLTETDMRQLFGKFARLSAQPTGGEHSTGLGLSIVKKLTESLHGTVWAESAGKDQGSTFILELPRTITTP